MNNELRTLGLVDLNLAEMVSIEGGKFAYWLGVVLGVAAIVGLAILLVL